MRCHTAHRPGREQRLLTVTAPAAAGLCLVTLDHIDMQALMHAAGGTEVDCYEERFFPRADSGA
ncbi:hypothetical protein ADK77_32000 [Streptomyces antibioticus]|nr:hypothetical protein ADK77_32000 [Streptomyces antibioticus]